MRPHNQNRIRQLLNDNRKRGPGLRAAVPNGGSTTVFLYDMIVASDADAEWWGGVSPEAFNRQLEDIKTPEILLRVNSPGGDVFAARAIEQGLRQHSAKVTAQIDGLAASAASFIATSADRTTIAPGAFIMIHKGWTIGFGNADDFAKIGDLLTKVDGTIAASYAQKTGKTVEDLLGMMAAETWLTDQEAITFKFADSAIDEDDDEDDDETNARAQWKLDAYSRAPKLNGAAGITLQEIEDVVRRVVGGPIPQSGPKSPSRSEIAAKQLQRDIFYRGTV